MPQWCRDLLGTYFDRVVRDAKLGDFDLVASLSRLAKVSPVFGDSRPIDLLEFTRKTFSTWLFKILRDTLLCCPALEHCNFGFVHEFASSRAACQRSASSARPVHHAFSTGDPVHLWFMDQKKYFNSVSWRMMNLEMKNILKIPEHTRKLVRCVLTMQRRFIIGPNGDDHVNLMEFVFNVGVPQSDPLSVLFGRIAMNPVHRLVARK